MKTHPANSLLLALAISVGAVPATFADTTDATCHVRKEGETKHGATGPCTFSQRRGYIDIDLRNGDTFALRPTDKANHFKDQKGHKVVRKMAGSASQDFKWEGGKKITVTFRNSYFPSGYDDRHHDGSVGQTPRELRYLVNGRYVGGEVDDQMTRHGYRHVRDAVGGDYVTSYWRSKSDGDCVMVRLNGSRHVTYVANTSNSSCR